MMINLAAILHDGGLCYPLICEHVPPTVIPSVNMINQGIEIPSYWQKCYFFAFKWTSALPMGFLPDSHPHELLSDGEFYSGVELTS